jgi:hypothetical protein
MRRVRPVDRFGTGLGAGRQRSGCYLSFGSLKYALLIWM